MRIDCGILLTSLIALALGCGGDEEAMPDAAPEGCATLPVVPPAGDPQGHADPLGSSATEARAGRLTDAELPPVPSGLITWKAGEFVIANDRVALVIEDVGDSDLYDPWGGRPVGLARVENGEMVSPNNFGELFILTGRSTVLTESVSVVADGSDGGDAIIRVRGTLHPVPFFEAITSTLFADSFTNVEAAIDYVLSPGSDAVQVRMHYASPRPSDISLASHMHALMYTKRTPAFVPNGGFAEEFQTPYIALVDDDATSWAYMPPIPFTSGISVSGFVGALTSGFDILRCSEVTRDHAKIVIGSANGIDGVVAAVQQETGEAGRVITGTVTRGGVAASGLRVHATAADGSYLTRNTTDETGAFSLHVPATGAVTLTTFSRGDVNGIATANVGDGPIAIALPATGNLSVVATDETGGAVPVRIQVFPASGQAIPSVPGNYGEPKLANGRLHINFATTGTANLRVPPGVWEVVVSRGTEYELERQTVTVAANATVLVEATMTRSVATPDLLCADFHIHTSRSNDAADDGRDKVASAICDGLELPVRSDHEWVGDFSAEIAELGLGDWATGLGSIELTSFQLWGHMGVFPLVPDASRTNAGAPKWQTFPTAESPNIPFATLNPVEVFDAVRAREESPVVIINHPRGAGNYFGYVGYDAATGMLDNPGSWDTDFTLVEVFNDSGWISNRDGTVRDWLSIVAAGRRIAAVGSSDSHGLATSPVGYPRTCIDVGTDNPTGITGDQVKTPLAAGNSIVSGGIYVSAKVGTAGPGATVTGLGPTAMVDIEIRAATWVDVDAFDLVVDGVTVDTISIMPADAVPGEPTIRYRASLPVDVAANGRGFVVVAAYGDAPLEPVHPGRVPFGVSNPIFLQP